MSRFVQQAHGLVVAAPFSLGGLPSADTPDFTLSVGTPRPIPGSADDMPPGELIADLTDDKNYVHYTFVRREDGSFHLRWHGAVEMFVDSHVSNAVAHVHPDLDAGLIEVLAKGSLLAFVLQVKGRPILHASAVEHEGQALAIVGASGMGKSTLATLLCGAGARLITDDVLRAESNQGGVLVHRGLAETRLRQSSTSLSELFPNSERSMTADHRRVVALSLSKDQTTPLALVVVPLPDRDCEAVEVVRLGRLEALMSLSRFPRFPGWVEQDTLARQFQALGDLVASVPVVHARVPWGPPFQPLSPDTFFLAGERPTEYRHEGPNRADGG